jgi:hypothetical protein
MMIGTKPLSGTRTRDRRPNCRAKWPAAGRGQYCRVGKNPPAYLEIAVAIGALAACGHSAGGSADLRGGSPTVAHQAMLFPGARERLPPLMGSADRPGLQAPGITGVMRSGDWVDVTWSAPAGGIATVVFTPQAGPSQTLIAGSTATSWSFETEAAHGLVRIDLRTGKRRLSFRREI